MDGKVSCNFGDSGDNAVNQNGHDDVRDEDEGGPSASKCLTRSDEKTSTNRATQRNHLSVSALQAAFCCGIAFVQEVGGDDRLNDRGFAIRA